MTSYFDQLASSWDQNPMKVERARATAEQCRQTALSSRASLLDIGGGTGLLSIFLKDDFKTITIADTSSEMLRVAREKIAVAGIENIRTCLLQQDLSELTGSFSAIISLMTLHHVDDLDAFLGHAADLLSTRGTLMIADLYLDQDGSFHKHVGDFQGHDGFDIDQLSQKLVNAGFAVRQVKPYYKIRKTNRDGAEQEYPLFFMVAEKS